jgi:hypothetical protein
MMNLADLIGESHEGALELKAAIVSRTIHPSLFTSHHQQQLLVPMVIDLSSRQTALEDVRRCFPSYCQLLI